MISKILQKILKKIVQSSISNVQFPQKNIFISKDVGFFGAVFHSMLCSSLWHGFFDKMLKS